MARNLGARCRPINEGHPVCAIKRPDEAKTAPKVTNMIEDFVAGTACEANNLGEPGPQRKLRAASHGRAVCRFAGHASPPAVRFCQAEITRSRGYGARRSNNRRETAHPKAPAAIRVWNRVALSWFSSIASATRFIGPHFCVMPKLLLRGP